MRAWRSLLHPALLFVVFAWGFNFTVIKLLYEAFEPVLEPARAPAALTVLRYLIMWPLFALAAWHESRFRISRPMLWKSMLAQFVASGIYMVLFMEGMRMAGAGPASVIISFSPLVAILLAWGLKLERGSPRLVAGLTIASIGVALVGVNALSEGHGGLLGILLLLASALSWGVSVVMSKPVLGEVGPFTMLAVGIPAAMLLVVPYGWDDMMAIQWQRIDFTGWWTLGYLALVAGFGAFWAYYKGLADVGPTRTGLTQYLIPPVASILGWLVLGERMGAGEWIGLVCVLAGLALARPPRLDDPASSEGGPTKDNETPAETGIS